MPDLVMNMIESAGKICLEKVRLDSKMKQRLWTKSAGL